MLEQLIKKENTVLVIGIICLALWYYRQAINQNQQVQNLISLLPIIGGLAFGFNTLINLTK